MSKTPEKRVIDGNDARQLLDNALFKQAFENVEGYLDAQALSCDPDNKDKAQRIVISKQLLAAVQREIIRVIEDGAMAQVHMQEIEQRKRFGIFKR